MDTTLCHDGGDSLWPTYRHNNGRTGFSPLKGGLEQAPQIIWSVNLGGRLTSSESLRIEDLNGDGDGEILHVGSDSLVCRNLRGLKIWEVGDLPNLTIHDIRDYAGDGGRGILVHTNNWQGQPVYMIDARTGHRSLLYTVQSSFGGSERTGHILPGVPGQQLCVWWDGTNEAIQQQMGHGYLWSFENGLNKPHLRFKAEESGTVYAAKHLFADMDGDGKTDMAMISHEQMWIYDLESGRRKSYSRWAPEIRSYSNTMAAEPLRPNQLPALLMINPHIPGVQVLAQDGITSWTRLWKNVIGPSEDQYQRNITIEAGLSDPFVDLDSDGQIEILTTIANEHGDGQKRLVIFGADHGNRMFDRAGIRILTVDDLDDDGVPEILLLKDEALHIANWNGKEFVDRWESAGAQPMLTATPPEGKLNRSSPGGVCFNPPLWRESTDANEFLLRFGQEVWSCRLTSKASLEKVKKISMHEALGNLPKKDLPAITCDWDGRLLVCLEGEREVFRYKVPVQQVYMPPPALVGRFAGKVRVVLRDSSGTMISYTPDGRHERDLVKKSPAYYATAWNNHLAQATICDVDGDGENELVTVTANTDTTTDVVAIDDSGTIKMRIKPIPNACEVTLGATGSLGKDPRDGQWLTVAYRRKLDKPVEAAYNGRTGRELWRRDTYGLWNDAPALIAINYPTAVYDYDGDGADDQLVQTQNDYGIISVKDNRDLISPVRLGPRMPGHWVNTGRPIVAYMLGATQPPQIFLSRANAHSVLMDLQGHFIWHYKTLPSDNMPMNHEAIADLDGDGRLEIVVSYKDGLLRAFDAQPDNKHCPTCLAGTPLTSETLGGRVRWTSKIGMPVLVDQDFASADLDGDSRTEILIGGGDGRLYALKEVDMTCQILWSMDLKGGRVGSPALADLDADGIAEILVPTENGRMHCLSGGKKLKGNLKVP